MKNLNKIVLSLIFVLMLTGACATRTVYIKQTPPAKRSEVRSNKPDSGYIWIDGYWKWSKSAKKYVWKKGHWEKQRKKKVWVSGHWKKTPRGWTWTHGYWK